MILDRARSALVIVDLQERLAPAISHMDRLHARMRGEALRELHVGGADTAQHLGVDRGLDHRLRLRLAPPRPAR